MGLWLRILARYLVGIIGGVLVYAGLPPDMVALIRDDPELLAGVGIILAAIVEWLTVVARRHGWLT